MAEANGGSGNGGGRDRGEGRDAADFDRGDPEHGTGAQRDVGQGPGVGIDVGGLGGSRGMGRVDVSALGRGLPGESFSDWGTPTVDPETGRFGWTGGIAAQNLADKYGGWGKAAGQVVGALAGLASPVPGGALTGRLGGGLIGEQAGRAVGQARGEQGPSGNAGSVGPGGPTGGPSPGGGPTGGTSPELVAQRSLYEHPMLTQFYRTKFAPQTEANDSLARWVFRGHPSVPRV